MTFLNNFEVITEESGLIDLNILNTTNEICAVISNYNMTYMNGLEFIEKAIEINNSIPFHILSSSLSTEEFIEAIESEMINNFFQKSVSKNRLL